MKETSLIMLLPAFLLFGWLWQTFSPVLAFSSSAGCALAAALLLCYCCGTRLPLKGSDRRPK